MSSLMWFAVAPVGGLGAMLRFGVERVVARRLAHSFPFGTLVVNLSGAFALLAGTAAVGSYTTFSTWMLETHRLSEERQFHTAAINVVLSVGLGLAATMLGQLIGQHL